MENKALTINPAKLYSIQEIVEAEYIPFVRGYAKMYNLVTQKQPDSKGENKTKYTREKSLATATSRTSIAAKQIGDPSSKINGKIVVEGIELIKFLKIHQLV